MHEEIMKRLTDAIISQLEEAAAGTANEHLLKCVSAYAAMRQVELLGEIADKLGDIDISLGMIADSED